MSDAVIVSTARTPIGKAYRGTFNNTTAPTLTCAYQEPYLRRKAYHFA